MPRAFTVLLAGLVLALSACGPEHSEAPRAEEPVTPAPPPVPVPAPTTEDGVLYDDTWVVEEGVWYLGPADDMPRLLDTRSAPETRVTGLLETVDPRYLLVMPPGLYGKYRVRIELHPAQPRVPAWCEDVVEVPLHLAGEPLAMGSFESFSEPMDVPAGDYRVRYCASELDAAAGEEEFDGDDYHLYSGRHLFQLWQAPRSPAAVVSEGSDYARELRAER